MRISIIVTLLLTASISSARRGSPQPAGATRTYAIGELLFDGPVSAADKQLLEQRTAGTIALILMNYGTLAPADDVERVLREQPQLRNCRDDKCSLQLGDALRANRLLTVKLTKKADSDWSIGILNFSVDTARMIKTVVVPCPHCSAEDVLTTLTRALDPVLKDDPQKQLCRLRIASTPSGGTVLVDGTELGRAPFEHTFAAGTHTIAITREGYARGETSIDCHAESTLNMNFTLSMEQPTAAVVTEQGAATKSNPTVVRDNTGGAVGSPHKKLFLALAGVGGAVFVGSTIWLIQAAASHGDTEACAAGRCLYRDNNLHAVGLAVAGMAIGAAATTTFLVLALRRQHPATVAINPIVGNDGAALYLGGSF